MSEAERIHDLLPWYLNGTLAAGEAARFAAHLPACAECHAETDLLRGLQEEIRRHGEEFFAAHPSSATVVEAARRTLPAEEAQAVRRHLALCATCAAEVRWVAEDLQDRAPAAKLGRGWHRGPVLPWTIAAALLLALLGLVLLRPLDRGTPGILRPHFVDSVVRGPGDEPVVSLSPEEDAFLIYFHVEAAPADFPLVLEVRDPTDRLLLREEERGPLFRDRFLFLHGTRGLFRDGSYRAEVRPAKGGDGTAYRFRIETRR